MGWEIDRERNWNWKIYFNFESGNHIVDSYNDVNIRQDFKVERERERETDRERERERKRERLTTVVTDTVIGDILLNDPGHCPLSLQ